MQAGNPEPSDEPSDERTQSSFAELDALARRAAGEHNVLSTSRHNRNPLQFRSAHAVLIIPPRSTPQTLLHPPRIACASLTRAHQHLLPTRSSIAAQYFTTPASWQRLIRGRTLPCSFTISQPLSAVSPYRQLHSIVLARRVGGPVGSRLGVRADRCGHSTPATHPHLRHLLPPARPSTSHP